MRGETVPSARRRKLEEHVDHSVAVLDRERTTTEQPVSTIENQRVRNALQRNRQYGDLPLDVIQPDPDQVRRVDTSSDSFEELVASVREHGVLEPITVRWIESREFFQIVTGERRYQAAKRVGIETIPAVVRDVTDTDKAIHQLVENLQREGMNPIEEAKAFRRYLAATGQTQGQLAKRIGKSNAYVSQLMSILEKLNRTEQDQVAKITHAKLPGRTVILEALRVEDPKVRLAILRGELTRERAREHTAKPETPERRGRPRKNFSARFEVGEHEATVVVRFNKPDATHDEILSVLKAVTKDFEKRRTA